MIKVAIYENSWNFDKDEPSKILTFKEFEKEFTYLGHNKTKIEDLFKTENEEWKNMKKKLYQQ